MRLHTLAAALILCSAGSSVFAASFNLSFTDQTGSQSLALLSDSSGSSGQFLITSAVGSIDGRAIVRVLTPNSFPASSTDSTNDNLLLLPPSPTLFDFGGISFLLFGGTYLNLFADAGNYYAVTGISPTLINPRTPVSDLSILATPEPGSLALIALGFTAAVHFSRQRRS